MEIVYAILLTAGLVGGNPTYTQVAPPEEMTINECLKQARELNYTDNTGYVIVCVPRKEPPVES